MQRRWRIGKRHVEIGLPFAYVAAALARLRRKLSSQLERRWSGDKFELHQALPALHQLLDLELAIIDHAYRDADAAPTSGPPDDDAARRRAERDLRNREARMRAILDAATDAIITIDETGIIVSANRATERVFGYSNEEMVGRNVKMLMPPPFSDEHDEYLRRYRATSRPTIIGVEREVLARRKDGVTFPIEIAINEVFADGLYFTGIIRDVTEIRRAREKVLEAERLSAIGQMSAGLAHESRNALQRIQAGIEMLRMEMADRPGGLSLLDRLDEAQQHLHQLYEEVCSYAAPINLVMKYGSLAAIWRRQWANLNIVRGNRLIHFVEKTAGIDLNCDVDPFAFGQVFRNVLDNAIAAVGESGQIVLSAAEGSINNGGVIAIHVHDSGAGFSPDVRHRVFEPFFTTKTKGTGLGMAIAKRIMEAHGGRIEIGSPLRGGEIILILPRKEVRTE